MKECVFVDANKNVVRIKVECEPNGSFRIDTDKSMFWLYGFFKPASESQERFLKLLKRSDLEFLQERFKPKFIYAVEDIQIGVQKAEDKFLEALGEREFWEYLKYEVDFTKGDFDTCCRIQAIFDAMDWPYHFIDLVDFSEEDYSIIKIGGRSFYCDEEQFMESVTTRLLYSKNGLPQWKLAVQKDETRLGFADWCELACRDANLIKSIDKYYRSKNTVSVDRNVYFVGARQTKI